MTVREEYVPPVEPNNAGQDIPDDRDWDYAYIIALEKKETEEEGGSADQMITIEAFLTIYNQGSDSKTINACGHYGLGHNINAARLFLAEVQTDPKLTRIPYQDERQDSKKFIGTSLQQNLNWFKNTGKIKGYGLAMDIETAKQAIDRGDFIYTGSNNGDRTSVRVDKVYKLRTDGKIVGHLFCIIGYDDDGFIGVNSYGHNNGFFHIPYELWGTLYTRYAVLYKDKKDLLVTYRAMKTIEEAVKVAVELGITNGERLKDNLTREEGITLAVRVLDIVKDMLGKKD